MNKPVVSVRQIDQCLPQTQCTLCGYPRCLEYAKAIAAGDAKINQCPPGGSITIAALAKLLDQNPVPLNEEYGSHEKKPTAWIREHDCIGCKLCIKACPVDAIVGADKLMHTVIAKQCTGCKLCVPVCPTDCIELIDAKSYDGSSSLWPDFAQEQVERARLDVKLKLERLEKRQSERSSCMTPLGRKRLNKEIQAAVRRKKSSASNCS